MTVTVQTNDSIGSGIRIRLNTDGDSFSLLSGVTVASTQNTAIEATGDGVAIDLDGTAIAGGGPVIDMSGPGATLSVGATGSVFGAGGTSGLVGIALTGGAARFTNAGEVSRLDGIAVRLAGGGNSVVNSGRIEGETGLLTGAGDQVVNTGEIAALGGAARDNAIAVLGADARIVNDATGLIVSAGDAAALRIAGTGSRVENDGGILSTNGFGIEADVGARLFSYGTLGGGAGAFRGSDAADLVVNGGRMTGDVLLGAGDDTYRGRADGFVEGTVSGRGGNDRLSGGRGDDRLDGGADNDLVTGGAGDDTLMLGAGRDVAQGGDGDDRIVGGGGGRDEMFGGRGDDELRAGPSNTRMYGGDDNDTVFGGNGNDSVNGGLGDDVLRGNGGNDTMRGGDGSDRLYGGAGDDEINGGNATDTLTGNAGRDVFVFQLFAGDDKITDFEDGIDRILLQPYNLSGFGDLVYAAVAGGVRIYLDPIGGEGSILIENFRIGQLSADDFIF